MCAGEKTRHKCAKQATARRVNEAEREMRQKYATKRRTQNPLGYGSHLSRRSWYTWTDIGIEGNGVEPSIETDVNASSLADGIDKQMLKAMEVARNF